MPDAKAFKPGDIVTTCIGKTIEVLSTDAEGRLLLADALGYASKQKPDFLLDVATLTGATRYALGHVAAPYLTTSDTLASKFEEASRVSGEKVWRLPLWDEYRKQIDSDLADMKNTGGAAAGTITAAMLLKEFTAGIPWLHLDIAAMDMQYEASEYIPRGASGFGVRVLTELLCNL
jgi:leucyl aminopeptidase